ncbi:MAG: glutamate synthase large subunit [Acidimicrobiales bacterium]|nr:glutamate synthase large subunit [Acidimicrobiales bacterium]
MSSTIPESQGLYDPQFEHDSCGVNFICHIKGHRSHRIVEIGVGALCQMQHRGALGAETNSGDGAGLLIQIPDRLYREEVDFDLPPVGFYATGIAFLPNSPIEAEDVLSQFDSLSKEENLTILGWREVPINDEMIGPAARAAQPQMKQLFIAASDGLEISGLDLDRLLYGLRKRAEHEITPGAKSSNDSSKGMASSSKPHEGIYFPSLSSRTIVYKGMLTTPQLAEYYLDINDPRTESALALVHSRFSTNTFPSWPLAHPYRLVAHNGEINTVQGNRNWMKARESQLDTDLISGEIDRLFPICAPGASDTAAFDEALELLVMGGYSLPEAVMTMIPEPWEHNLEMPDDLRAFYQYHSSLMEPWDGPASIAFTDGSVIGAVLDRNGLRPSRYWVTDEDLVIMASEVGVADIPSKSIVEKGRLEPGKMFLIDTKQGRIIRDEEIKEELASARPYQEWLNQNLIHLKDPLDYKSESESPTTRLERQQIFGYTHEQIKILLTPMIRDSKEAIGSMGSDTPIAVLSDRSRQIYDYFQQLFAQVTNPPLDAIREELITAVSGTLGPRPNILELSEKNCAQIHLQHPIITESQLAEVLANENRPDSLKAKVLQATFTKASGVRGLQDALTKLQEDAESAIESGAGILVISDRESNENNAPIPSLLATGTVHHYLTKARKRGLVGIVVESGDARETHHMALLLGFGASAVCPYMAYETIDEVISGGLYGISPNLDPLVARKNFVTACDKGLLKIMSKMGISTVASYTGAQIFESIGLDNSVIDLCFTGTSSRIEGIGFETLAEEVLDRHSHAFPNNPRSTSHRTLEAGGEYQWRREGEHHLFNPETIFRLQHATREGRYDIFKQYTNLIDEQSKRLGTLRGLFQLKEDLRPSIPIEEVEPISEIVKRFSTGAMSYGSISAEAHEVLAIAMNRIGGKSNTGEGGEDPDRFTPDESGDLRRSAIKQVASGRFGVTSEYLVNSDDIQIKMAQGAKPGEGGQLPGHKVYPWIAKTRHSTPGVALISPPPHHDIYSIEDLAQLIFDLKNANPKSRVHVKLVAEVGVGTVATGVSKAHADVVLISGHDGGTGASPLTSIKHAGAPWELGLAETQQTLLLNRLRDRIVVQVDGQLKTGRDVVIAALLGADEYGFATAPLVVSGCVMMRVCHLDTCPVGVATQNPELRKKFSGKADHVVNFFEYIAQEVREILADLGFRSLEEAIGQVEVLNSVKAVEHWKAKGLDLSPIFHLPAIEDDADRRQTQTQNHGLEIVLDQELIKQSEPALKRKEKVDLSFPINNTNRSTGTMLGYQVTKKYGGEGLPDNTISINFSGSAGNSFGAFLPSGVSLHLEGDANDYVGKGLSGGNISIKPPKDSVFKAEEQVIAGNVILYGATSGQVFIRGKVGERFCVRNSGATAVVEGIGDHGCEYMTGGKAVILGPTGRNFAAGMSGGVAYVHDPFGDFVERVNHEMVLLEALNEEDEIWLKNIILEHQNQTDSVVAEKILNKWGTPSSRFIKIMSTDYKRVLEAAAAARNAGKNEVEAIMASSGGN